MAPVGNFGLHAVANSNNFLMFSRHLGSIDPDWKYNWDIGGYCFNDDLSYSEETYRKLMDFIKHDARPVLFFTLGSCNDKNRNKFCEQLLSICQKQKYKLVVGSGWSKTGTHLTEDKTLYILKEAIPHSLIFTHCTAVIHHGGCGTTHSVARSGVPQMIVPLILDQPYWGYRVTQTGTGPQPVSIKTKAGLLGKRVADLVTNPSYKKNAEILSEKMKEENGVESFCRYIEQQFG